MSGTFDALLEGTAPLQFTSWLTSTVSVVTYVFGEARNEAFAAIKYGSVMIWSGTMIQAAPTIVINTELIYGSLRISRGATFTLTIPTPIQLGNVFLQIEFLSPPNPAQQFSAQVSSWPLSSFLTPATVAFLRQ
ncbi:MAG TPA: hypothetical protein VF527_00305 [Pyrinomonadaceae bacterium]|jgi:hypothetical protein